MKGVRSMSAYLQMTFQMTSGSDEDFQAILHVLEEIGEQPIEALKQCDLRIYNNGFCIENHFPNIWGKDFLVLNTDPYIRFAKAAPKAKWEVSSLRHYDVDGSESRDKAGYSNGVLDYEGWSANYGGEVFSMDYDALCDMVSELREEESDELTVENVEEVFDFVSEEAKTALEQGDDFSTFLFAPDAPGGLSLYLDCEDGTKNLKYFEERYVIDELSSERHALDTAESNNGSDAVLYNYSEEDD